MKHFAAQNPPFSLSKKFDPLRLSNSLSLKQSNVDDNTGTESCWRSNAQTFQRVETNTLGLRICRLRESLKCFTIQPLPDDSSVCDNGGGSPVPTPSQVVQVP